MLQRTETGWRGDFEMRVQHNNSLSPARITAVGKRKKKKQELDVVSFLVKSSVLCGLLRKSRNTTSIKLFRHSIDGDEFAWYEKLTPCC